ncbi:glycoside hydrolase family 3 C-terminal domain-containing protein [Gilvibacter sediminis]|uniref:glycoside hydrolase family 3 C-terminal domain-containing protein n=1 Tax=Gilvibacter sediminis TaxID=379071 RepID=UPI00234FFC4E|nr:glycoside hydrolase family 3 C-terminal domain-containing protein [Gilvibacter sediminis]MDC7996692.1 glycoside hydrolase family 3 C-terminal domain-containing protein [Gilvibacter sediminis]
MKKWLKKSLKVLGVLLLLVVIVAVAGWMYLKATFLDFEDDYRERTSFDEIVVNGQTFLDRNSNGKLDIYEDPNNPINARIADLLEQMTLEEKIHLLKGSGIASAIGQDDYSAIPGAVGTIVPTPRLGLPTIYLSDGPAGLRIAAEREGEDRTYYCTAFPIATLLASTWNKDLVYNVGDAMGTEALEYGVDVILGPGTNLHRHPFCGRNFEYYSEDPFLTGHIGAAMVNGIESNGVGTSVKHFVVNNQETNRNFNDALVSERALREIYLKGFEIIVKESQPWTIMSSYNLVNGTYVAESEELLTDVLRSEWGFEGLVMSDWFGGNDAVAMVSAGNDLLEPGTNKQWKALTKGYEEGTLSEATIDRAVGRILKLVLNSKKMSNYQYSDNPDLKAHAQITRNAAAEGMVLLKNDAVLPLNTSSRVALLGITSYDFIAGGTGSGDVNEAYTVSLEEGLKNAGFPINADAKLLFESHKAKNLEAFKKLEGLDAMLTPYDAPEIQYSKAQLEEIAAKSDVAIITIGRNSGEGGDRVVEDDFQLSSLEQQMIANTKEVFGGLDKKVIVVLNIGGVIETASWKGLPDAILLAWQGGQEGGNATADILVGKLNPSGKLPMTFPIAVTDHASHNNFPLEGKPIDLMSFMTNSGVKDKADQIKNEDYTLYDEGVYVGYRHFDKNDIDVSYPFGYGLSYTAFEYSEPEMTLDANQLSVTFTVTNVGEVSGKEVVQLYIAKEDSGIDRPIQELKAFEKTALLEPGASATLNLKVSIQEFAYWDEALSDWVVEKGDYTIKIGSSSRSIHISDTVSI